MATFAAPPMAYRNFAFSPPRPVDAEPLAEPEAAEAGTAVSEDAATFPLLNSALPGIIHFPTPRAAVGAIAAIDHLPQKPIADPAAGRATAPDPTLDRLIASAPPEPPLVPESQMIAPRQAAIAPPDVPFSRAQQSRALRQDQTALASARDQTTPLKTLFGILRGATPPRAERTATTLGLQNLFRRL